MPVKYEPLFGEVMAPTLDNSAPGEKLSSITEEMARDFIASHHGDCEVALVRIEQRVRREPTYASCGDCGKRIISSNQRIYRWAVYKWSKRQ